MECYLDIKRNAILIPASTIGMKFEKLTEWLKPVRKDLMLFDSIYMKCPK